MAQIQVETMLSGVIQVCRECPMRTLVQAYVDAARKLCNHSRWLLSNVPGVTVAGTQVYTFDLAATGDTFNEVIGIQAMSLSENATTINALTEGFSGGWDPNPALNGNQTGLPSDYQYVPQGKVALSHIPNAIYSFTATVVLQPKRASVSVEDRLASVWDAALEAGALAYLLALPRTPWTDKTEARMQGALFEDFKNQAASSVQRGYNAGAQHTNRHASSSGMLRTRVQPI